MDPTPPILLTDEFFDLPFKCCAHYFYDILTSCGTLPDRTITLLYKYRFTPGFLQHPIDLLWTTSVTFLLSYWHLMKLWHHLDLFYPNRCQSLTWHHKDHTNCDSLKPPVQSTMFSAMWHLVCCGLVAPPNGYVVMMS